MNVVWAVMNRRSRDSDRVVVDLVADGLMVI